MDNSRSGPWLKILLLGIIVGVGLVAAAATGMRYSDQRPFCSSCHLMREAAVTHKMSPHAQLACNDCHMPQNLVPKIPAKAAAGFKDFLANIAGNDVPLGASTSTKNIINANCKACHTMSNASVASMDVKPYCTDCHANTAHMRKLPVSKRMVAYE